jgi:hypothetical protein
MNKGFNQLWPTTLLYDCVEDKELLERVISEIYTEFDMTKPPSDFGELNIFDNGSKVLTEFKEKIVIPSFDKYLREVYNVRLDDYKGYNVKGWITGNVEGYTMASHNHSGSHLTSTFYVMAEDTHSGGHIVFTDPRSNANRGYPSEMQAPFKPLTHRPSSGEFMIFPSFLYHHVTTYYSNFRLCIPVDLFLNTDD